jgi:antirestriction protein ArdC
MLVLGAVYIPTYRCRCLHILSSNSEKIPYYLVYNIAQCDGIPEESVPKIILQTDPIKACEAIVATASQGLTIRNKESATFYDPLEDYINIPKLKNFLNPASYYSELFHQLAHSTGHHTRLDRMGLVQMSEYGCNRFTQEELVAEIVTNYLENFAGIPCPFQPSQEYIDGWVRKLRSDKYFIFTACTLAQKAIDFILNIQDGKEE